MKVVFFNTYNETPHYETELELMQKHLDKGDEVIQINCDEFLNTCVANPFNDKLKCNDCVSKRKYGISVLSGIIKQINVSEYTKGVSFDGLKNDFSTIEELKSYAIEAFDIGMGVASTLISRYSNINVSTKENADYINSAIKSAYLMYRAAQNILKQKSVDCVYVFNGRFFLERAILRVCEKANVKCMVHERGNSKSYYALFEDTMPHNIEYIEKLIQYLWESESNSEKRNSIATDFFESKIQAKDKLWHSFVGEQVKGLLPEDWDSNYYNIVIFPSSEHEFSAIGDQWNNKIYKLQIDGLLKITEDFEKLAPSNFKLYLRIHPNIKNAPHEEKLMYEVLKGKRITIISAHSEVSTYTLLQACNKVVTFGSTMGIEATYWGKPSVLAGSCFYKNLGATYNPMTHKELVEFVLNQELPAKEKEGALKYAFYLSTFGVPFDHYKANSLFSGEFNGKTIHSGAIYYHNLRREMLNASGFRKRKLAVKLFIAKLIDKK